MRSNHPNPPIAAIKSASVAAAGGYLLSMVPVAASGQIIMGVVIVGAVLLLAFLLRDEARSDPEERPPDEL